MGRTLSSLSFDDAVFERLDEVASFFEVDGQGNFKKLAVVDTGNFQFEADTGPGSLGLSGIALGIPSVARDSQVVGSHTYETRGACGSDSWLLFSLDEILRVFKLFSCFRVINSGPPVQYIMIRADLPRGFQAAQVAHAAGAFGPHPPETHVVVLAVKGEAELVALEARLREAELPYKLVIEPDAPWGGQAMSIGCGLVRDRKAIGKVVSNLPLLR